jgi:hypothetical protein
METLSFFLIYQLSKMLLMLLKKIYIYVSSLILLCMAKVQGRIWGGSTVSGSPLKKKFLQYFMNV